MESLNDNLSQQNLIVEGQNNEETIQYDKALTQVGGQSLYQKILALNLGTQWIFMSLVFMSASFWLQEPQFICENDKICTQAQAIKQNRCSKQYLYDDGYKTITIDLGMYCDNESQLVWAQSILYIGAAIGSFLLPQLSDIIGRKIPIVILHLLAAITIILMSFCKSYIFFMILYFLLGLFLWPVETIIYVVLNESINGKLRDISMIGCMVLWSIGEIILAGVAYGFKDWRDGMFYVIGLPFILYFIPNYFCTIESPMFQIEKSKQKCLELLNKIADFNKKPRIPENKIVISDDAEENENDDNIDNNFMQELKNKKYSVKDIFVNKSVLMDTISCSLVNGGLCIIYFGTTLSITSLDADPYISLIIIGACEAISNFACSYFVHLFKRKQMIMIFYFITTLICLSFIFFTYVDIDQEDEDGNPQKIPSYQSVLQLVLSGLARVCNIFAMAIYSLYCQEVFPTPVRSMASGFTYAFSTLLSFTNPLFIDLAKSWKVYPTFILGIVGGVFNLATFMFEETLNKPNKQFIPEEKQRLQVKNDLRQFSLQEQKE